MTGFGRASVEAGERRLRVEIRSVNHRGLDLKIRGAEADAYCGAEIGARGAGGRRTGRDHGARAGRVGGRLGRRRRGAGARDARRARTPPAASWDRGAGRPARDRRVHDRRDAGRCWKARRCGRRCGRRSRPRWPSSAPPGSRKGAALAADIGAHRTTLVDLAARLRQATAPLAERFSRRLTEKLDAIRGQPGFEPGRIAQEAALMADRLDVSRRAGPAGHAPPARGRADRRRGRGRPQARLRHPGDRARAQHDRLEGPGRGRGRAGDRRESGAGADA